MEELIEEKLKDKYKHLSIEVNNDYFNFRTYEVKINFVINNTECNLTFNFKYNVTITLDANINQVEQFINKEIISKFFYK